MCETRQETPLGPLFYCGVLFILGIYVYVCDTEQETIVLVTLFIVIMLSLRQASTRVLDGIEPINSMTPSYTV